MRGLCFSLVSMLAPDGELEPVPGAGEPVELSWSAPAECPDGAQVLARASVLLRREARSPPGERLAVHGRVEAHGGGYRLELRAEMAAGVTQRSMSDARCEILADAAAVVIAVAIDPLAALSQAPPPAPAPAPAPVPVPEPAPPPVAVPIHEPAPTRPGPRPPDAVVRASGAVEGGALPGVGGGVEVSLGVALRRGRFESHGSYWFPRTVRGEDDPSLGGRFSLWAAGLRACVAPEVGPVAFPLCAGAEAGQMIGIGFGVRNPAVSRQPWAALVFAPHVVWQPIPRLGLVLGADLVVPLTRPGFGIDFVGPLWRTGPVSGRGKLGLEVRFL